MELDYHKPTKGNINVYLSIRELTAILTNLSLQNKDSHNFFLEKLDNKNYEIADRGTNKSCTIEAKIVYNYLKLSGAEEPESYVKLSSEEKDLKHRIEFKLDKESEFWEWDL